VMRDIRTLEADLSTSPNLDSYIKSITYEGKDGRSYPAYALDKDTCLTLLTGYDAVARMKVIKRWQELEAQQTFNIPTTLSGALRLASEQAELIEQQNALLAEQAPKVAFHDAVESSQNSIPVGVFAKILAIPGLGQKQALCLV